jgi:hypothetical protein
LPGRVAPNGARGRDGAIAQLGERLLCKQEVVGSIPSGSTRPHSAQTQSKPRRDNGSAGKAGGLIDIVKKGYAWDAGHLSASPVWNGKGAKRCTRTLSA